MTDTTHDTNTTAGIAAAMGYTPLGDSFNWHNPSKPDHFPGNDELWELWEEEGGDSWQPPPEFAELAARLPGQADYWRDYVLDKSAEQVLEDVQRELEWMYQAARDGHTEMAKHKARRIAALAVYAALAIKPQEQP